MTRGIGRGRRAGIVERRVQAQPGGGVAYALTGYGMELEDPVLRLGFWGAKTMGSPDIPSAFPAYAFASAALTCAAWRSSTSRGGRFAGHVISVPSFSCRGRT